MSENAPGPELIRRFVDEVGSLESLWAIMSPEDRAQFERVFPQLHQSMGEIVAAQWGQALKKLQDFGRWHQLANAPKQFDKELELVFSEIRALLKLVCGIPSHRPKKERARDEEIWRLRHNQPPLTFGQIAQKLGMSPNSAERAYARYAARQKEELRRFLELFVPLASRTIPPKNT